MICLPAALIYIMSAPIGKVHVPISVLVQYSQKNWRVIVLNSPCCALVAECSSAKVCVHNSCCHSLHRDPLNLELELMLIT